MPDSLLKYCDISHYFVFTEVFPCLPVYKLHMSEWEVSHFAVEFSFPLTVYGHFGYFDNVTNLRL